MGPFPNDEIQDLFLHSALKGIAPGAAGYQAGSKVGELSSDGNCGSFNQHGLLSWDTIICFSLSIELVGCCLDGSFQ